MEKIENMINVRKEVITCSFELGNRTITEDVAVTVYVRTNEKMSFSSTGKFGKAVSTEYIFKTLFGGYSSSVNEVNKNEITQQLAYTKYDAVYNAEAGRYFKKSNF